MYTLTFLFGDCVLAQLSLFTNCLFTEIGAISFDDNSPRAEIKILGTSVNFQDEFKQGRRTWPLAKLLASQKLLSIAPSQTPITDAQRDEAHAQNCT